MNEFKKKVKEKIKQYSSEQYLDGYIKNEFLTDDNDADIYLNINSKDELFDSKTVKLQKELNNEIYEYLEEKTKMLGNDIRINLHVVGTEFTSKEQEMIKHILKEHYAIELYNKQVEYNEVRKRIFLLIMIGICSFALYFILYSTVGIEFVLEVLSFLFSFALWEALDAIIYEFREIKYDREAITQNLLTEVDFNSEAEVHE